MTAFEIKAETARKMSDRIESLKAVKVADRSNARGCNGRSDGSYRCSSR